MSQIEELKQLAREADQRGDRETASAAMDRIEQLMAQKQPERQSVQQVAAPAQDAAEQNSIIGSLEALGSVASGIVAEPVAGLAGLAETAVSGPEAGEERIQQVREAMTYEPRTETGQERLRGVGETLAPIGEAIDAPMSAAGEFILEKTGSPALATATYSAPYAAMEVFGLKGLNKLRKGTRLIDDAGAPTKALRKQLNKQGLVYENLTPESKSMIPQVANKNILPSLTGDAPRMGAKGAAERALKQQLRSGSRDDALAGLRLAGDEVKGDALGARAMTQGFLPGDVQMVKTANKATKKNMGEMLNIMERVKKNSSLADKIRPTDVAGKSVMRRLRYIRDKATDARNELNNIAKTKLKGKEIDRQGVLRKLDDSLENLGVKQEISDAGVPVLDFKGSIISKNKRSQKAIKDAIDLLSESETPDAYRAHIVKRQLDDLIDFNKRLDGGLSDEGRRVLMGLRKELNNSIRAVDSDYARVNDVLSQSLGVMEDMQDVVGKKYDLFDPSASSVLGTKLRRILSNADSRIQIRDSVVRADEVAKSLGGKFDDSVSDLMGFANALDDRFGTTAGSSFAGQIKQSLKQGAREGATRGGLVDRGFELGGEAVKKARGIDDFGAFESMRDLLNRSQ